MSHMEKQICGTHYETEDLEIFMEHLDQCWGERPSNKKLRQKWLRVTSKYRDYEIVPQR